MSGMRPADVREKDHVREWSKLYGNNLPRPTNPREVGNIVTITKIKWLFEKGYVPNRREEHFHITSRIPKIKPVFSLADDLDADIKRQFFLADLQPIEENRYLI